MNMEDGSAMEAYITSAPIDLGDGDIAIDIMQIVPDFKRIAGAIYFYLMTRVSPQSAETVNGPFQATSATDQIDVRVDGAQVAIKVVSNAVDGDFRLGDVRIDIRPGGEN
jgi:hypothetical protein